VVKKSGCTINCINKNDYTGAKKLPTLKGAGKNAKDKVVP